MRYLWISLLLALACSPAQQELPQLHISHEQEVSWTEKLPLQIDILFQGDSTRLAAAGKYRGGMSSAYWKHNWRIELDEGYPLGGLPVEDDWVLNASYIDKSFMRHSINYDLYRAMRPGRNMAPSSRYVEVKQNGNYEGLYILMQKVTAKLLAINKRSTESCLFKDPSVFRDELPSDTLVGNVYAQKWPKYHKEDRSEAIRELHRFLLESSDEVFAREVATRFDLAQVMDWHLLLLFMNNGDGLLKNFYLYRQQDQAPWRIAIWDADHSLGRDGDGESNMLEHILEVKRCSLLRRLLETDAGGYQERLKNRYAELREELFTKAYLENMMRKKEAEMAPALARNAERWPYDDSRWYYDTIDHAADLDSISRYVELRLAGLDVEMGF